MTGMPWRARHYREMEIKAKTFHSKFYLNDWFGSLSMRLRRTFHPVSHHEYMSLSERCADRGLVR